MKKAIIFLTILVFCLAGIHFALSYRPYNVILITTDTLRADYLSCYNPDIDATPNFDRLAKSGVLFTEAYTTIPITLAAHTAILTSHAPTTLNLFNNGEVYDERFPVVSELLARKGYKTAAFISLGVLKAYFGLGSAFQHYDDHFDEKIGRYYKTAAEVNQMALPWIEQNKDKKFFAWIHYSDPHEPYVAPDAPPDTEVLVAGKSYGAYCLAKKEHVPLKFTAAPGKTSIELRAIPHGGSEKLQAADSKRYLDIKMGKKPDLIQVSFGDDFEEIKLSNGNVVRYFDADGTFDVINDTQQSIDVSLWFTGGIWNPRIEVIRDNYESEVQYLDHHLGVLLDKLHTLNLENRTIIILTSDHGEGLKSHGYLGHVGNLHNEVIHVPLIIRYPGMGSNGKSVSQLVNHLDITPTILDLVHVENTAPMEGGSLKYYFSRSPIDWMFAPRSRRIRHFAGTYQPEAPQNSFAMVEGNYKLIFTPTWKWEVYDTATDPFEKKNIARMDDGRFDGPEIKRLRDELEEFSKEALQAKTKQQNPKLNDELNDALKSLGYVSHGQTRPSENQTKQQN